MSKCNEMGGGVRDVSLIILFASFYDKLFVEFVYRVRSLLCHQVRVRMSDWVRAAFSSTNTDARFIS